MKKALKNYLVGLAAIAVVLIFVSLATSMLTMFFTNLIFKMGLLFATVWRVQYLFFSGVAFLYETFMYVRTLVCVCCSFTGDNTRRNVSRLRVQYWTK